MSTILIVDDEPSARETLVALLEGEKYDLKLAGNGFDALKMTEDDPPDLILLDVMMPNMDGFEVCRRIRATPKIAEVPIVILTALDDHASLMRGIDAGADDFLSKPVDRHELRARVRTITRLNRYQTLMEQRENLRMMADRMVTAQEQERQRISRELHDDLGQALTTHMLAIHNLQDSLPLPKKELVEQLQALYQQSHDTSVKIRRLAQNMRPPTLDALGLNGAMQAYCEDFTRRTGLPVIFQADETLPPLSDMFNITLYRVLQEALTNVVKHAGASQVWADLTLEDRTVTLIVQDNGRGFVEENVRNKGIGLTGLRERLTIAGGVFKISSSPVRGTILMAQLPQLVEENEREKA